jgi:uncharacterized protein YfiM (DUF2279 family)
MPPNESIKSVSFACPLCKNKGWIVKRILVILTGVTQLVAAQPLVAPADSSTSAAKTHGQDQWLGKDKMDHFTASAFVAGAQYYVLRGELEQSHAQSLRFAIAGTMVLGVAKEIYDGVSRRGTPSFKDVVADVVGIGLAAVLLSK